MQATFKLIADVIVITFTYMYMSRLVKMGALGALATPDFFQNAKLLNSKMLLLNTTDSWYSAVPPGKCWSNGQRLFSYLLGILP